LKKAQLTSSNSASQQGKSNNLHGNAITVKMQQLHHTISDGASMK